MQWSPQGMIKRTTMKELESYIQQGVGRHRIELEGLKMPQMIK
jgi:hypothetical protein